MKIKMPSPPDPGKANDHDLDFPSNLFLLLDSKVEDSRTKHKSQINYLKSNPSPSTTNSTS